jgi:hypothetical protein
MAVDKKLLEKARNSPANFDFNDLLKLVEQLGWKERNIKGSHHVFSHPQAQDTKDLYPRPLNLQRWKNGRAKLEQVKEVLKRAESMGIIEKGGGHDCR